MNDNKKMFNITQEKMRIADEEYFKLCERNMEIELKLIEKMPSELMGLLNEYMDVHTRMLINESESEYARGFNNGVHWMSERADEQEE